MDHLQRLWAPWRTKFLSQRKPRGCIFCIARRSTKDRQHHVVERGRLVFAILNRYPYNNGHVMVAPCRHVGKLDALTDAEWTEILMLTRRLIGRLRRHLRAQGFNVGLNLGRVGGAGIPGHLHVHLVPRWQGDTNFIPLFANTKVISQSLDELYRLLARPAPRRRPR